MIKKWWLKLTGGRPMDKINYAFTDLVDGNKVYYFRDKLGRKWMANNKWSWFRVEVKEIKNIEENIETKMKEI